MGGLFNLSNGNTFGGSFMNTLSGGGSSLATSLLGSTGIGQFNNSLISMFGGHGLFSARDEYPELERYLLKPQTLISFSTIMSNTRGKEIKGDITKYSLGAGSAGLSTSDSKYDTNFNTIQGEAIKNKEFFSGKKYATSNPPVIPNVDNPDSVINNTSEKFLKKNFVYSRHLTQDSSETVVSTEGVNQLEFKMPDWGYQDFINERAIWQKSLYSSTGQKGWFYFKVFFNFDTQYGLLGGLLNDESFINSANSAAKYLWYSSKLYPQEKLNDRIIALHKFASILSFISSNAPWFFKSVKNLNNASIPVLTELSKEKSIELEFNPDAIDMRVSTLFDLYKFACYDDIGQKEIIPENLRKFDMTVVLFETPLRYLHTAAYSRTFGKFKYKTLDPIDGYDKMMSCKMYHFMNCEFDLASLANLVPNQVSNEQPFEIGSGSVKIIYDRVYTHTMNEFMEIMFGSDGIYYNTQPIQHLKAINGSPNPDTLESAGVVGKDGGSQMMRYAALQNALFNKMYNPSNPAQFKDLVDASESICHYNLMTLGGNALGNIAGGGALTGIDHFDKNGKFIKDGTASKYFKLKYSIYAGKKISVPDSDPKRNSEQLYTDLRTYYDNLQQYLWGHPVKESLIPPEPVE